MRKSFRRLRSSSRHLSISTRHFRSRFEALEARKVLDAALAEVGTVTFEQVDSNQWHTVELEGEYVDPIVVAGSLTRNGSDPATIRVQNVTSTSFEVQIDEWEYLDGYHTTETFSFLVVERGVHELDDGRIIEAGTIDTDHEWADVDFMADFENPPIVLSQAQSMNDPQSIVTRHREVDEEGFEIRLQEEEARRTHAVEQVGYVAIEVSLHRDDEDNGDHHDHDDDDHGHNHDDDAHGHGHDDDDDDHGDHDHDDHDHDDDHHGHDHDDDDHDDDDHDDDDHDDDDHDDDDHDHDHDEDDHHGDGHHDDDCDDDESPSTFEAGRIDGVTQAWHTIRFSSDFESEPVFLAQMQTFNEDDTSNVRHKQLRDDRVFVQIDEERSRNSEIVHKRETVGYAAFPSAGIILIDAPDADVAKGRGDRCEPNQPPPDPICLPSINFETDADGNDLSAGDVVKNAWDAWGVHVTTQNPRHHPPMIFDTSNPTGGDDDLATPGDGIGNTTPLGNVLIISEDGDSSDPDDNGEGGKLIFEFDNPVFVDEVHLLDIDSAESDSEVRAYDYRGRLISSADMLGLGDNSFQIVSLAAAGVSRLVIEFEHSGAVSDIIFCGDENTAPEAVDDQVVTDEDTSVVVDVLANDSDVDGDTLTVTSVTDPASGTVQILADGTVEYVPTPNFNGSDSFDYTISDGNGGTSTATVFVSVEPVDDPPTAEDDAATTDEDTPVNIDVLANDVDLDGDTLEVISVTRPFRGTAEIQPDGTITYTPSADYNGLDGFNYTISDGTTTSTATVSISITPVNDPPVAVDNAATTDEDAPVTNAVLANDFDVDGDPLEIIGVSAPSNGTAVVNLNGTITYTPNPDFNGADSYTYTISDGNGGTDTATVLVTVDPVNEAPVANADQVTTDEDTPVTIDVLANDTDADNDPLAIDSVSDPSSGTAVIANGSVVYTPNANFNGSDSFDYTISDGNGGTDTATVSIQVAPVNDPPNAIDDTAATSEDIPIVVPVLGNDIDVEGDSITVTSVTSPANGTANSNGDGTITYVPNPDFNGTDSFEYTVIDGNGGQDTATVTVTVRPVNDPPTANSDDVTILEDTPVDVTVLANDTDPDVGDTLTVTLVTRPFRGTAEIVGGTVRYTPNANYNGLDAFDYTISDGNGGTSVGRVNISVTPVNDPPVAVDNAATTDENSPVTNVVLLNDFDVDVGDVIQVTGVSTPANGVAVINPNGTITYTPNPGFIGQDSYTYTISDGSLSDTATVTIDVVPADTNGAGFAAVGKFAYDEDAVATDKAALVPGEKATFANFTSSSQGITRLVIDVTGMPTADSVENAISFRIGNDSSPANWAEAPRPNISMLEGKQGDGEGQVVLTWNSNEIQNTWLEVRFMANNEALYFGNRIGDANGDGLVDAIDYASVRANPRNFFNPAAIDNPHDINRDGRVNSRDLIAIRDNFTGLGGGLVMIAPPPIAPVEVDLIQADPAGSEAPAAGNGVEIQVVEDSSRDDAQRHAAILAALAGELADAAGDQWTNLHSEVADLVIDAIFASE